VELIGRSGNLILAHLDEAETPLVLGALNAGRVNRPFERGRPYRLPPPRPERTARGASLAAEVEPDPKTLALGLAVAAAQREVAEASRCSSHHASLSRAIRQAIKRRQGVLKKLDAQLAEVERADEYERRGDLIKANLESIPRGASRVKLVDYSSGEPLEVELELEPAKSARAQMKALYKRARKLRSGEASVRMRQGETDAQIEELRALGRRIEEIDPEAALAEIEAKLKSLGALPKAKPQKVKQQPNLGPRSFRTLEGHEILVGRSDEENDQLTMRMARGRDLFFHVRGCPGSHVILRVDPKRPPNHESILDAAAIAVHYSKARDRGACDVSYTPRKWVRKPRGAKPGLVQISNEKTVRLTKDRERSRRVLATARGQEEEE
jgi:predicted ribosome quality control (RQC) complex YloA/Tae2 family protein